MDVDTIVTGDLSPIVQMLAHTELIMFGAHIAFLAARPNSTVLSRWVVKVQERLSRLNQDNPPEPGWDYVGNAALADVMADMISALWFGRIYDGIVRTQAWWPRWARTAWSRSAEVIWVRGRRHLFRAIYPRDITMLDRKESGFIAERTNYRIATPSAHYVTFWFEEKPDVAPAFGPDQRLIGLHNSWTPDWYKQFTTEQVLEYDCRLSKVLRRALTLQE